MSALFPADDTKYLSATLTTGADYTKYTVISAHVYWSSAYTQGFDPIMGVKSGTYMLGIRGDGNVNLDSVSSTNSGTTIQPRSGSVTTMSDDTWYHCAAWFEPADISLLMRPFVDATAENTAGGNNNFSAVAANYTDIEIGKAFSMSGGMTGRIAEVSVWEVDTSANAETLIGELATKLPSAVTVSGATMVEYWSLESDANSDASGDNLTNNGTVTFSAGTHPSLTGGGGGGSTAQVIGFSVI